MIVKHAWKDYTMRETIYVYDDSKTWASNVCRSWRGGWSLVTHRWGTVSRIPRLEWEIRRTLRCYVRDQYILICLWQQQQQQLTRQLSILHADTNASVNHRNGLPSVRVDNKASAAHFFPGYIKQITSSRSSDNIIMDTDKIRWFLTSSRYKLLGVCRVSFQNKYIAQSR